MQKALRTLIALVALSACGPDKQSSEVKTSLHPDTFKTPASAFYLEGNITSVKAQAAGNGALGLWSTVEIEYVVPCHQFFKNFSYTTDRLDGKTVIFASAIATSPATSNEFLCQAFTTHVEKVVFPGILTADSVELINMKGAAVSYREDYVDISSVQSLKLVRTRPLCDASAKCIEKGTIVTVAAPKLCINQFGPNAFVATEKTVDGATRIDLKVSAYELVHKNAPLVRCAPVIAEFDITLRNILTDKDQIDLTLVK